MINYDYNTLSQGQISVQKDPKKKDVVISRLLIKRAQLDDSGNYTCSPSNAEPASAYVHVLQGNCGADDRAYMHIRYSRGLLIGIA